MDYKDAIEQNLVITKEEVESGEYTEPWHWNFSAEYQCWHPTYLTLEGEGPKGTVWDDMATIGQITTWDTAPSADSLLITSVTTGRTTGPPIITADSWEFAWKRLCQVNGKALKHKCDGEDECDP